MAVLDTYTAESGLGGVGYTAESGLGGVGYTGESPKKFNNSMKNQKNQKGLRVLLLGPEEAV